MAGATWWRDAHQPAPPSAFVHNYLQFGDAGLLKIRNGFGRVVGLHPLSSVYLRRREMAAVYLQQGKPSLIYRPEM